MTNMDEMQNRQKPGWLWQDYYPANLKWDQDIPVYPVPELLGQAVRAHGKRPAIDFMGRKWNWGEIGAQVDKLAKGLQDLGVQKGTKVGLFLPNSPNYLVSYFAVMKAGGTVVNFNPLYAERELAHQIENSEADYMITLDLKALYDKMEKMLHETRLQKLIVGRFIDILPFPKDVGFYFLRHSEIAAVHESDSVHWLHNVMQNDGNPEPVSIDPEKDVAVLQYTGGTTGVPKGAMLTHANVSANVEQCVMWFHKVRPGQEKMLGVLPFFHVFAMTAVMNMAVRCGFEIIAVPRFELEDTLKIIQKKKPQYFPAVPAIYNAINHSPKLKNYNLSSLLYCISGGAPLPIEVKKNFEAHSGCVVVEGYGLSESSPVACVNPLEGENKAGSIGLPLPGTVIEIISLEDRETPVKQGMRGEICIRGPQVMAGYYNNEEETNNTLRNGRLHTGDIATMDEEGYTYIVDRLKDMIITNGYNVYPRNIEEAIYLHPDVEECIVAGVPDKARGEIVKAWVKPKEGHDLSVEVLKQFLQDKISKIEMPRTIEIRQTPLPKTMIGKLSRKDVLAEEKEKSVTEDPADEDA